MTINHKTHEKFANNIPLFEKAMVQFLTEQTKEPGISIKVKLFDKYDIAYAIHVFIDDYEVGHYFIKYETIVCRKKRDLLFRFTPGVFFRDIKRQLDELSPAVVGLAMIVK